ncbi:MAG: hypothetical protein HPY50_09630 [Firmicutes bacterium]|nr:hypothetical protein [Bacillota bacterium]
MLVVGTFEYSLELEQALAELERDVISRSKILVVSMDTEPNTFNQFVRRPNDLLYKGIEVGIACATAFSVVGTSVGFALTWGPIIWGLGSALAGFVTGFGIYYLFKKRNYRRLPKNLPEITVIIQCPDVRSREVMGIMWKYRALTVGRVSEPD